MQINKLPKSQIEIKSTIAWDEWKKYIDQAVEKLGKDIKVSGFRPGKAPRNIVEQKVGAKAILEEAGGLAIQKDYIQILEKEKLDVIGRPQAEFLKLAEGNDLEYKITTDVMPEIAITKYESEIKNINKKYNKEKIEVTEDEIKKELEQLANSRVMLVTVAREAKSGDSVILDFQVLRDGAPIENGTSKNHPLVLGKGVFIPGFEENIIGMKENEEKEFELKFPEDYHEKSLAGKPATFKVKVNLVQERQVPQVNDDFAKSLGKFENLEALRKSMTEGILEEKKQQAKEKRRTDFIEELVKKTTVDLPEVLVHEELHKMIHEFSAQIEGMGMKFDDYLAKMKKNIDEIEKEWEPQAEKRVKSALILEKLARIREINVSSEKVEEEMNKTLQYYKKVKDLDKNIDMTRLYNYTKGVLVNEEVFKWLESL
jgi:trigger factor